MSQISRIDSEIYIEKNVKFSCLVIKLRKLRIARSGERRLLHIPKIPYVRMLIV